MGQVSPNSRPAAMIVSARLRTHGAELVGAVEQFEDVYRLCHVRGPEGIVVGLAQQLR